MAPRPGPGPPATGSPALRCCIIVTPQSGMAPRPGLGPPAAGSPALRCYTIVTLRDTIVTPRLRWALHGDARCERPAGLRRLV
eukprot:830795-Prorocentrum_minimum.AAC.2